jgi:hypothetical protein
MARNVIPILFTQMFSAYHFCGPLLFMIIVLVFLPMIFILHAQVFLFVALSALIFLYLFLPPQLFLGIEFIAAPSYSFTAAFHLLSLRFVSKPLFLQSPIVSFLGSYSLALNIVVPWSSD